MLLFFVLFLTGAISTEFGYKTLILIDNPYLKSSYSSFFNILKSKKLELELRKVDNRLISLKKYGDFAYDNLIILGSSFDDFGGSVDLEQILSFLESGRNIFVIFNDNAHRLIRNLGSECGVEIDKEDSFLVDNFNSLRELDDGRNSIFAVSEQNLLKSEQLGKIDGPVAYSGAGMVMDPNNELAIKFLHASSTTYPSSNEKVIKKYPIGLGKSLALISAIQTRGANGRALFAGSTTMFSDLFMNFNKSYGNRQLVDNLVDWTFQRKGVIRIKSVNHSLAETGGTPAQYTINDIMLYKIELEEFKDGRWRPFVADDAQLEIKRIDTFIRVFMNTTGNGLYTARIRLPDVFGVFKIIFEYNRVSYSNVEDIKQITIRPLRHNQYERYIVQAYPYYAVVFTMMAALFIFFLFWLRAHAEHNTTLFDKVKED